MINFSIHNYKEWMGAYLNAQLNKQDMLSAESFLQQHPLILDQYLNSLNEFTLSPEPVSLNEKSDLEIHIVSTLHINTSNFSEYFIAHAEGLLDMNEEKELQSFLTLNPSLQKEFNIYQQVKLVADTSVVYPDKNELVKTPRRAMPLFWALSAAASILVVVGLYIFWPANNTLQTASAGTSGLSIHNISQIVKKNNQGSGQFTTNVTTYGMRTDSKQKNNHKVLIKKEEQQIPVSMSTAQVELVKVSAPPIQHPVTDLARVPVTITEDPINETLMTAAPKKKGLFNKIFSGEQLYIEDYVNATFTAFSDDKENSKWVLKVDRDETGKSRKVKFTSPIFSTKNSN